MIHIYFFAELGFGWVITNGFIPQSDDIVQEKMSDLLDYLNPEPDEVPIP